MRNRCLYLLEPAYLRPTAIEHTSSGMCLFSTQHDKRLHNSEERQGNSEHFGCVRCNKLCECVCVFIYRNTLFTACQDRLPAVDADCLLLFFQPVCVSVCVHACACAQPSSPQFGSGSFHFESEGGVAVVGGSAPSSIRKVCRV